MIGVAALVASFLYVAAIKPLRGKLERAENDLKRQAGDRSLLSSPIASPAPNHTEAAQLRVPLNFAATPSTQFTSSPNVAKPTVGADGDTTPEIARLRAENQKLKSLAKNAVPSASPQSSQMKRALYRGQGADYWIAAIQDRDLLTRREAALALASIGKDGIEPAMKPSLRASFPDTDEMTSVRLSAAIVQVSGPDEQILAYLDAIIQADGNAEHFQAATEAASTLGLIGPAAKRSIPTLRKYASEFTPPYAASKDPSLGPFGRACQEALIHVDPEGYPGHHP